MRKYPVGERRRMTAVFLKSIGWKAEKGPDVTVEKTGFEIEQNANVIGAND